MHFRVVTRGNNPNLVLENCREALEVLRRSGLPEARYKVDVATDKHMHTMSEVPEVHEIVVVSASLRTCELNQLLLPKPTTY